MNHCDSGVNDPLVGQMRATFDALNAAAIPYVVLRGFQPIDELVESADIDMFIPCQHLEQAARVLAGAGWMRRAYQVGRHPHVFFDSWQFAPGVVRSLDIVTDLCFGDALYRLRGANKFVECSDLYGGVRVPGAWHSALAFALHVALDKGALSAANARRASEMTARCRSNAAGRSSVVRDFGEDAARFVETFLDMPHTEGVDVTDLATRARSLESLRRLWVTAAWDPVRRRLTQLRRPVARIAVLGVDGSGKTTLIAMIRSSRSTLRVWSGYLGYNEFRTPPARWLQSRLNDLHARSESGLSERVLANLNIFWWHFELLARMLIAEHRSELVLYDRYPLGQDDGSPTTWWGRLVYAYTRFTRRMLPRPDLVVFLDGDDQVLWNRKREFPFEMHQRTQQRYRDFVSGLSCEVVTIRTDGSLPESIARLKQAVIGSKLVRRKLYGAAAQAEGSGTS